MVCGGLSLGANVHVRGYNEEGTTTIPFDTACHVRDLAATLRAPVGAVLEGHYDLAALPRCVIATLAALSGVGDAESIAPEPILTRRAAAQFGRYWRASRRAAPRDGCVRSRRPHEP